MCNNSHPSAGIHLNLPKEESEGQLKEFIVTLCYKILLYEATAINNFNRRTIGKRSRAPSETRVNTCMNSKISDKYPAKSRLRMISAAFNLPDVIENALDNHREEIDEPMHGGRTSLLVAIKHRSSDSVKSLQSWCRTSCKFSRS